jgi:hypothetical protein
MRSAAAVNEEIRMLIRGTGRRLTDTERAVYERLVAEWAEAVRAEVVEAA